EVEVDRDVDHERLALLALVLEDAVVGEDAQTRERQPVEARHADRPDQAPATSSAMRVARTSCTRTPHAPDCAASALVTEVARSRSAIDAPTRRCTKRFREVPMRTG